MALHGNECQFLMSFLCGVLIGGVGFMHWTPLCILPHGFTQKSINQVTAQAALSGDLFQVVHAGEAGSWLTIPKVLMPVDDLGNLKFKVRPKRVAFDVGLGADAPASRNYKTLYPSDDDLAVIAIEASTLNYQSIQVMFDKRLKHPNATQWGGLNVKNSPKGASLFFNSSTSITLVNAAASNANGYGEFSLGDYMNIGTGSIFKWSKDNNNRNKWWNGKPLGTVYAVGESVVPVVKLESIIRRIPRDIKIEQIKIDAQNADPEVMVGIGSELERVKCITAETAGELDDKEEIGGGGDLYASRRKIPPYKQMLKRAGFVMVPRQLQGGDTIYVNRAFKRDFKGHEPNLCFSPEQAPGLSNAAILGVLNRSP